MSFLAKLTKKKEEEPKEEDSKDTPKKEADEKKHEVFVGRPKLNSLVKLFFIIAKNFKLIFRSKRSSILFLLGPLIIVFLLALAFNTSNLYDLNVAVYSDSYSTISDEIIGNLSDSQYNVQKMESEQECIDSVKYSNFQLCAVFPPNMILDNSANNIIKIHVDNSRMNIAYLISAQISSKVSVSAEELSEEMVTVILTALDTVNTEVTQSQATTTNLKSANTQASSSASGASTSLEGIDLSASADTTTTDTELTDLKNGYNLSAAAIADLEAAIDSIISTYETAMSSAETGITSTTEDISSLTTTLTSEKEKIEKIETSLNNMATNIDTIKITNVDNIVTPIRTNIEPINSSNSYLLYIMPSILIMLIMFIALLLSSSSIVTEKTSLAYFRNFITPTTDFLFILGQFLSAITIMTVEIIIIMATLYFFVPSPGVTSYLLAAIILMIVASLFIFSGMLIGYMFNTKQTVTLSALSVGIVLLFFSNTILPLETLSKVTRKVVMYNPFVIGESILKKLLLFGAGFHEISLGVYMLLGFVIAVFIGAIVTRAVFKRFFST